MVQRYKLFSSSKIEKVVSEIECYSEYPEYNALRSLEGLESIPIANKTRIEKIIEKYDHSRKVYAALLGEIKDDLLDLNEAIYMGKEEFKLIESEQRMKIQMMKMFNLCCICDICYQKYKPADRV